MSQAKIPIIKRFSGGGTVFIDQDTIFVTFISNAPSTVTPRFILEWTKKVYTPFFPSFALLEVLPAKEISLSCAYPCLSKDHRKATTLISI